MVEDSEVDIISVSNISKRYISVKLLGKGGFGKVYKCLSLETKELVALKAVQENYGKRELDTLKALRELDQDKNNLVRFYKHHEQRGMVYLEFELLDITIYEYMDKSGRPLLLSEIQVITQQMLVALNALKSISLVHADIKPNNIMLVNHKLQPMKVKLIDFGLTIPVNTVTRKNFQVLHFRAPEVMLGLPLNEATDMWCLGSVLAYMYLGQSLHTQGQCKYLTMKKIVEMHGQPAYYMLKNGKYTKEYFLKDSYDSSWWLINTCSSSGHEHSREKRAYFDLWSYSFDSRTYTRNLVESYEGSRIPSFGNLDEFVLSRQDTMEYEETQVFSSLLKQMLEVDPEKRITPSEALQHPFMTLKHFHSDSNSKPNMPSYYLTKQEEECNVKGNNTLVSKGADTYSTSIKRDAFNKEEPLLTACPYEARITFTLLHGTSAEGINRRNKSYVEVKTQRKYFKRIHQFFSRLVSIFCCGKEDVTEKK
ncbi:hypothetical protein F2P81_013591 [Scophthalmus maximus]|uniref:Protein kinase domain-containing protein n=2 Tax=Scophthalmus maximus TaxID=52904 RepID=A0A6A4SLW9_SCOMX|nr:hypothetical protein F2P81_013591 [Scophthalmus maximus]